LPTDGLNVVRIGEPARVRGALVKHTLRCLVEQDDKLCELTARMQRLMKELQEMNQHKRRGRSVRSGWVAGKISGPVFTGAHSCIQVRLNRLYACVPACLLAMLDLPY
jgi:hypothetical protein